MLVYASQVIGYLDQIYDNRNKHLDARDELRNIQLTQPKNFIKFRSKFTYLANLSKLRRSDWVEEFHRRMYPQMRIQIVLIA